MRDSIPDSQDPSDEAPYYIDAIHPINAKQLCATMPHRFYADHFGAIMELTVRPMAELLVERHASNGGIIGINYTSQDMKMVDTVIFNQKGKLFHINEHGYLDHASIDVDRLYYLLNPVEINGWHIIRDPNEHEAFRGVQLTSNRLPMSVELSEAIRKTQDEYRFLIHA